MEKRRIRSSGKVTWIKSLLIIFFLGGLISCNSTHRSKKNTANMPRHKTDLSELLTRILELNGSRIGNSEQIILVTNTTINSTDVSIQTFEKKDNHWIKKFSEIKGSAGRNGFSPYQQKREGDNTSPTGIYDLGPVFGYADKISTKMDYRQATDRDFWIDDPQSEDYNKWVTMETPPAVSHEKMKRKDDLYKLGIVVQYNTKQVVRGNGSAIFVHIQGAPGSPTAGCIAMPESSLDSIIQWLHPKKQPLIVMGTIAELERITM